MCNYFTVFSEPYKSMKERKMSKDNKYEIDMCNGSIMDKLISFALPLMLSGMLQLMFNAVDIVVVGRFSGSQSLAAVGATTALIYLFTNLFIGISLGANVLSARYYAAGKKKEMSETVHTAMAFALVSGIVMIFVGLFHNIHCLNILFQIFAFYLVYLVFFQILLLHYLI